MTFWGRPILILALASRLNPSREVRDFQLEIPSGVERHCQTSALLQIQFPHNCGGRRLYLLPFSTHPSWQYGHGLFTEYMVFFFLISVTNNTTCKKVRDQAVYEGCWPKFASEHQSSQPNPDTTALLSPRWLSLIFLLAKKCFVLLFMLLWDVCRDHEVLGAVQCSRTHCRVWPQGSHARLDVI